MKKKMLLGLYFFSLNCFSSKSYKQVPNFNRFPTQAFNYVQRPVHAATTLVRVLKNTDIEPDSYFSGQTFREDYSSVFPEWLLQRMDELGYSHPTLVQKKALEVILDGKDAVIHAQTGSGKTLAFLLPIFASIDSKRTTVQALIVVPTRELGMQVASVAKRLAAGTGKEEGTRRIQVMSLLEGSQNKRQRAWAISEPPQVVIGNPEAIARLIKGKGMRYNSVRFVVVDEVDACLLDEKTRNTLNDLLSKYLSPTFLTSEELVEVQEGEPTQFISTRPKYRQTIFLSATIPQHNHFIKQCYQKKWVATEPVHVYVTPKESIPATIEHHYIITPREKRLAVLREVILQELHSITGGIVFAQESWVLEEIAVAIRNDLEKEGLKPKETEQSMQEDRHSWKTKTPTWNCAASEPLREEYTLNRRASVMEGFRNGQCRVLVSSDLAARGIDIPQVSHIFNFDLPKDAEAYLHRAGRAGRLGRTGTVISFITTEQEFVIQRIANQLGIEIGLYLC